MTEFQRETLMLFIFMFLACWKITEIFIWLMSKIGVSPVISIIILTFTTLFLIRLEAYRKRMKKIRKQK